MAINFAILPGTGDPWRDLATVADSEDGNTESWPKLHPIYVR